MKGLNSDKKRYYCMQGVHSSIRAAGGNQPAIYSLDTCARLEEIHVYTCREHCSSSPPRQVVGI